MRSPEHIVRHVVRCDWRCKHCGAVIGSERIAHYGENLPDLIKPTWFFAAMALLDHLRDCPGPTGHESKSMPVPALAAGHDYSDELRQEFGPDFLNHPLIYNWYNQHALIERHFVAQEELE